MFKRILISIVIEALCLSIIGCTSYTESVTTTYTTEDLQKAFPVGMPIDTYIIKKM